ncbi:fimbrial biogenesis outer membrane usher protein [Erwinia psidii]|uniref:Fimbrial biogenesis outer membrane usher protein n=2 Tax=Erwinia psidii TaxID=69224 RepID=A0A3N6USL3_9GAMM|nr:fimbrial biogenesis outer membrane usher protein [Erwinia psidii]
MHQSEMSLCHKPKSTLLCAFSSRKIITTIGIVWVVVAPAGWAAMLAPSEVNVSTEPAVIEFNPSFMHGTAVDVSRFDRGNFVSPGDYPVTVTVNNQNRGKHTIHFTASGSDASAQPCFTVTELERLGIRLNMSNFSQNKSEQDTTEANNTQCQRLMDLIAGSSVNYDGGDFLLSVVVPQVNLIHFPRGYIDPTTWESGVTAGFIDYNANLYSLNSGTGNGNGSNTLYSNNIGLLAGFNAAGWHFRKRFNTNWSNRYGMHTQSLLGYVQTDITPLKSQLIMGDSNTRGDVFDSFTLRGVQLQSDERMLPEGIRNYTPVLRGIAETNAKISVTQRGRIIYETTLPPGPFELTDIGAMGYGGDLLLTITEADGRQRSQSIPYSAPPMLLHEGVSNFGLSIGQLRDDVLRDNPTLFQGVYQYGLSSTYTLYGGMQASERYHAIVLGNSVNTSVGGIYMDGTFARSELRDAKAEGNSFRIGYSKYLEPTNTDFTLAAYRYSTKGFYTFREASIDRYGTRSSSKAVDYRAREKLTLTMGQRLWNNAYIHASGSIYNYWDERSSARQYSLSYNQSGRYFSWSLSASRSYSGTGKHINSYTASISVPIGQRSVNSRPAFSSIHSTYTRDNQNNSMVQMNASGSQGDRNEFNYGIGTTLGRYSSGSHQQGVTGNANYRSSYGQAGITASLDSESMKQLSLSANGSVVAHQGGVTLGPQLSDLPFAIISVPGGENAKLLNGYGSSVDSNGYAIMPSLTPYRYNSIAIDAKGLPDTVDVLENESVIVPRAGSASLVHMRTIIGMAKILTVKDSKGEFMPIGTELVDKNGVNQTIVGQGGQAFIRGWDSVDALYVLGDESVTCRILPGGKAAMEQGVNNMEKLEVTCVR